MIFDLSFFKQTEKSADFVEKSAYKSVNEKNALNSFVKILTNIGNFFRKHWYYVFNFLFITILFTIIYYLYDVYPFGKFSVASYDMLAQITPFIEHLFDVFNGKSSLYYSTAIAGGADVFGTIAYCLISPFTPIFLIFGQGKVYYAVGIVLVLKLIVISFSALYYIDKKFPSIPNYLKILLSLLYGYSGYMFVANTYINWLDFLIYMPFVAIGFEKVVKEGKILYFAISYALMIYTCFSIACFAMILVFIIAMTYGFVVAKDQAKEVITKLCLALLLAVGFAIPIMLPSFLAYLSSGRNTGLFENISNKLDVTHLYRKITYVISDSLFLFLSLIYFIKNGIKRPIDRFLLFTGIILLMPVLVDECCNLLNAGSYMSYSLRFGFLNSFYAFYLSLRFLSQVKDCKASTKNNIIFGIILGLLSIGAITYFLCTEKIIGLIDNIYKNLYEASDDYNFYSLFSHSLGGLELIAPMTGVIFIPLIVATIFYKKRLLSYKVLSLILCGIFVSQLAFYSVTLVDGNLFNPTRYDQFNNIVSLINQNEEVDGQYFRIKDTADALTADQPLTTHTNSFSVFSSVIDRRNFTATNFFNYKGNGVNSIKSANGMFLGDMLLGYKYYYHHCDRGELTDYSKHVERPYVEELEYTQQDNFTGYVNKAVFPNAFIVKSGDLNFDGLNYSEKLNKLYNFLGGSGEFCSSFNLKVTDSYDSDIIKLEDDSFIVSVKIKQKQSYWFLETNFPDDYDVYYSRGKEFNQSNCTKLDGEVLFSYYNYTAASYSVCIKDNNNLLTEEAIQKYCTVKCAGLNLIYDPDDSAPEVYDIVQSNKVDFQIKNGNTFILNINADENDYLFMNFVALDGHKITINQTPAKFIDNGLDLMLLKLNKGQNNIVIKYNSPYVKYGVFGLIGGLFICLMVLLIVQYKLVYNKLKTLIYILAIGLFICVSGFFIIFPTAVCLTKLVKLLIGLF